ncbi:uncharacterized protein LOC119686001 [Teleopsis dalmanni]|uniref:uncharacterized protein LOC119686001 n=1 Tax=Teleopsis dalmanni TaxID=139649 RepID=UPI0018CC9F4D|nr:uncharacterized protein LOC119686001 [Teleopsis dalmanni]
MENNEFDISIDMEKIHLYCRVCLQMPRSTDILDVNTVYDEDENITYKEVFKICTDIDLLADFTLPCRVCKSCGLELQMVYDFHRKIKEAKSLLIHIKKQNEIEQGNEAEMTSDDAPVNDINLAKVKKEPIDTEDFSQDCEVDQIQNAEEFNSMEKSEEGLNMNNNSQVCHGQGRTKIRLYRTERQETNPYNVGKDIFANLNCTDPVSKKMAIDVLNKHGYFINWMFNNRKRHRLRALIYGVWRLVRVSRSGNIRIDTLPASKIKPKD